MAQPGQPERGADFAAERLIAPPRNSWPTNGGNFYNQRYSP
jgi:quinohemoprotein ethanol dehydrogenase